MMRLAHYTGLGGAFRLGSAQPSHGADVSISHPGEQNNQSSELYNLEYPKSVSEFIQIQKM